MAAQILEINSKSKVQRTRKPLHKRLFTIKEAAEYLGRSVYSMRSLIWAGKLPIIREERKIWLCIHDLDAWVERNKITYEPLPEGK